MKLLKIFKFFLVVPFFVGFVGVNAQTVEQNSKANSNSAPTEARANKAKMPPAAGSRRKISPSPTNTEKNNGEIKTVLNENDPYMGRSQEILERLTVKEIPADFPKYQSGYGVKYYNDLLDNYYLTHPAIVQKWVTDKMNYKPKEAGSR